MCSHQTYVWCEHTKITIVKFITFKFNYKSMPSKALILKNLKATREEIEFLSANELIK